MTADQFSQKSEQHLTVLYTTQELILIALFAALGLGTKQIVGPVVKAFTGAIFIPGGAVAGGFYMLWLALGRGIVHKPLSASFISLVQSLSVLILPYGSHGAMTLITYLAPGLVIDTLHFGVSLVRKSDEIRVEQLCLYSGASNVTGTALSAFVFGMFEGLNIVIIAIILAIAFFSGTLGGIVAFKIVEEYQAYFGQEGDQELLSPIEADKLTGED